MSENRTVINCTACGRKDVAAGHQCEPQPPIRVRIVDPEHPHYPEHGEFTGEIVTLFGKPMAKVKLDACRHGTKACFVSNGQVAEEKPVAITERITVDDLDNLRHMLGVGKRTPRGYRNCFVAGADSVPSMERLREHGFVVKNDGYRSSSDACYHATLDGARAIGLERLPR